MNLFAVVKERAWHSNVAWIQLLGLCPLLGVSSSVSNAIGLSIASAAVLICSALVVSTIRNVIPHDVRLPCYVLVVATFSTVATMVMEALSWELYMRVALFVQIIVTNCMILGFLEQTASKEKPLPTVINALGVAIGFSIALLAVGAAREYGAWLLPLAAQPAGAFIIAGLLFGLARKFS